MTAEDTLLLELRPFRVFRVGEIVAYEVPDEASFSKATSGVKALQQDARQSDAQTAAKVKVYAKVVSIGNASDEGIRRLNVKISSSGVVSALSTDIFSFKSARELNASKTAAAAASGVLRIPYFGSSAPKKAAAQVGYNSKLSATAAQNGSGGKGPTAAVGSDEDGVGRSELLGAVNGLLARAGVPIDMEQQVRTSMIRPCACDSLGFLNSLVNT